MTLDPNLLLAIPLLPLIAAIIAGVGGRFIGRGGAALVTILAVAVSFGLSVVVFKQLLIDGAGVYDGPVYSWLVSDGVDIAVGFLVDRLTALMMVVVVFVSLCVHVYTIGYMRGDPGYQRFFAYISLFTFAMLMLVMSNNLMQLYFAWEGVGAVSYLLIGFWYSRPSAVAANLKAFLVNRVGDFAMLVGIAGIFHFTGSLHYAEAFAAAPDIAASTVSIPGWTEVPALTLICLALFIGAMSKSAQIPLHVWLPDSMEGPTPISALIHAATMVTAGIFMVARMSPLYEYSGAALTAVLVIGATTALFMGFLGIVSNDIKRVIAYSTISQLGYMTVALGVSAYSVAIFHLMTHAFFKALLFLAAGAVIIAMHHEQDMRKMGGLRKRMPVTYWTCIVGSLALIGTPFFSGFYSKDALIEAVHESQRAGAGYAYFCVVAGVFVTALYTFRMIFLTFHGKSRLDHHAEEHFHDVGWDMKGPLVALAIPSFVIGLLAIGPVLFGDYFGTSIQVLASNDVVAELGRDYHGPMAFTWHALLQWPVWLTAAGVLTAWLFWLKSPYLAEAARRNLSIIHRVLVNKYYFDWFNENVVARAARGLGLGFWYVGDRGIIDGAAINGSAALVGWTASVTRRIQSGYLYSYAFWMVVGLAGLLGWFLFKA